MDISREAPVPPPPDVTPPPQEGELCHPQEGAQTSRATPQELQSPDGVGREGEERGKRKGIPRGEI